MSDFKQRESEASKLRKAGKFKEALKIYRELWDAHRQDFDKWATWSYAKCAQKCGHHEEADQIARHCHNEWPDFDLGNQVLAWSHYYRFFQGDSDDGKSRTSDYWKAAEEVVSLCEKDPYSKYSPFTRVLFSVVKELEDRPSTRANAEKRLEWLGRMDPDKLNSQADSFRDNSGKRRVVASDRENWYSHMSKALLDAERYEECIQLCNEALQHIQQLHYDNDVWFRTRVAKAKASLGRIEEAIADLKDIVLQKPEWHIYKEIATLAYQLKEYDDALRYGAEAALGHGPLFFKWELFLLMAVTLREKEENSLAKQHAQLSARIRGEKGWSIKGRTKELFSEFGVDARSGPPPKELAQALKKQWKEWTREMLPRQEGVIDWVHHEKPFGFIKVDEQEDSIYFQTRSFNGTEEQCTGGTRVQFYVKESYDNKKDEMSTEAVEVDPSIQQD
jgi:tetratricopeptide (TPR) repeat protein/cold shock CspA family protein